MRQQVELVFTGRFLPESFAEFVRHRAARLSLVATLRRLGDRSITVGVEGDGDLIDMFEMAASLGPLDCIVLDLERHPMPPPIDRKETAHAA